MVLHGQIEKAVRNEITDKQTGKKGHLWQIVVSDKTKPSAYRAATFFVTYLGDEKKEAIFGNADITDERVTLLASMLTPFNALIKVNGTVLKGWLTFEELAKFADAANAPSDSSAPVVVEKPKRPA